MESKARSIINHMITNFDIIFDKKDNYTDCALHCVVGKIGLACELELITLEESDNYIDKLFQKYAKLEKY